MLLSVDDLLSIGEFSERSGLSQKRLRSYAAAGLLVPAAVDSDNGYRYYSPGQLRDAKVIDALRRADVPLAVIATALHDPASFDVEEWARRLDRTSAGRRKALTEARRLLPTGPTDPPKGQAMTTRLTTAARTETGPVRENNEDAVIVDDRLIGVADGMGGPPGGEVASSLAAAVVAAGFTGADRIELAAVTRSANAAIFARAAADRSLRGMGTTLCAAGVLDDGTLGVVNVGDSRAYLVRGGALRRLTEDDTITAELVRTGVIAPDAAAHHPHRHVLTRVLGVGPRVDVEAITIDVVDGDLLLVCTDGLSGAVDDPQIAEVLARTNELDAIADALVERALSAGGHDDVTVAVARVVSAAVDR